MDPGGPLTTAPEHQHSRRSPDRHAIVDLVRSSVVGDDEGFESLRWFLLPEEVASRG